MPISWTPFTPTEEVLFLFRTPRYGRIFLSFFNVKWFDKLREPDSRNSRNVSRGKICIAFVWFFLNVEPNLRVPSAGKDWLKDTGLSKKKYKCNLLFNMVFIASSGIMFHNPLIPSTVYSFPSTERPPGLLPERRTKPVRLQLLLAHLRPHARRVSLHREHHQYLQVHGHDSVRRRQRLPGVPRLRLLPRDGLHRPQGSGQRLFLPRYQWRQPFLHLRTSITNWRVLSQNGLSAILEVFKVPGHHLIIIK